MVSKTMWAALDTHQLLIAADNPENHKQFDRMSLRTFVCPPHSTPQEGTDLLTAMRTIFDSALMSPDKRADLDRSAGAPALLLEACSKLMEQLGNERPQVMLDVRVYQIDHQLDAQHWRAHSQHVQHVQHSGASALAGLGGQSIQQLINQLISSGGINQAGSSALSGLLAQLGGQQNSIFSQPLATFGGGLRSWE